jgi:hypothetical protein
MLAGSVAAPAAETFMSLSLRPSVVIDPRLALSPLGLIAVARLSSRCTVWVPPELREVLRSSRVYHEQPERLVPRVDRGHRARPGRATQADAVRTALAQWSAVLASNATSLRTYHLADPPGDAVLPSHVDASVHDRFELLARGLDTLMTRSAYDLPRGIAIASCFRDAVALAAALAQERSFILSPLEAGDRGAPALCTYLEAWKIPVVDVSARAGADAAALRSVLARAGLGPVEWSGVAFAALHVVPQGLTSHPAPLSSRSRDAAAARLWEQTHVFWHRL